MHPLIHPASWPARQPASKHLNPYERSERDPLARFIPAGIMKSSPERIEEWGTVEHNWVRTYGAVRIINHNFVKDRYGMRPGSNEDPIHNMLMKFLRRRANKWLSVQFMYVLTTGARN